MTFYLILIFLTFFKLGQTCQTLPQMPPLMPLNDLSLLPELLQNLAPLTLPTVPPTPEEKMALAEKEQEDNKQLFAKAAESIPAPEVQSCEDDDQSIVIAVSTAVYRPETVAENLLIQRRSLRLLEAFTGTKVSRFGPYNEESLNINGQYAYKLTFFQVDNCADAKDFTTKAVSYSKHIEKAFFKCRCENLAIAKIH